MVGAPGERDPTPPLSVIVPVHDVEDYLRQCLDSLLGDPSTDLEVVAVDDGSTDASASILDAYAARDHRLVVVRLAENTGLGGARNAGLARATGEFVWFVDADDWVIAGAIPRVHAELRRSSPDVLLLGHARIAGWRVERVDSDALLADLPPTFRASEAPQVFQLTPSVCTKVIRRTLLTAQLAFPDGAYEDIPVAIPALAVAERVAALPDIFLYYRQRPGSIVHAAGQHHVDLISQYELVHSRLDRLGVHDATTRAAVYSTMVLNLFQMLGTDRIARADRPSFLRHASDLARRHQPTRYTAPSAAASLRHRLLLWGSLTLMQTARAAYVRPTAAAHRVQSLLAHLRRLRTAQRGTTARRLLHRAILKAYYRVQLLRPLDPTLALYTTYWGDQALVCNPGAVYTKARELAPSIRGVWAVSPTGALAVPPGTDHVLLGSRAYYRALARARFIVSNTNLGDEMVKRRGCTYVQTHHGTPLKAMGIDVRHQAPEQLSRLLRRCSTWDFSVSSNPHSSSVWRRAYPVDATTLESGYPRNDVLANATPGDAKRARLALGLDPDATSILYAPTHRDDERAPAPPPLLPHELADALGDGYVVLMRPHYFHAGGRPDQARSDRVIDASRERIEHVFLATDVLITDYSSSMFDFAVLDRPIVLYAPDWERYLANRGAYFDVEAGGPGVFARDFEGLVAAFRSGEVFGEEARARRSDFRNRFCQLDDGRAAERVVRATMLQP